MNGSYHIQHGLPGFDQTHVVIEHWAGENGAPTDNSGRAIIDDPTAGIWCPPAAN